MEERAWTAAEAAALTRARRGRAGRTAKLAVLAVVGAVVLAACGGDQPYSTISPRADIASDIQGLYALVFWAALVVFVGVQAVIVYTALRFQRRNENEESRPEQVHGNRRLEIAWTAIPAVVLLVIFIPTAQTMYDHADAAKEGDIEIQVYGNQWWWEFEYPDEYGNVITANEVRIPQGKEVVFNLRTNNVIHSFWVPQLSGKIDVIPGHNNRLSFTADRVGEYWGECAEFCGVSHAWMRFRVIVEPEAEFDRWVEAWQQPPPVTDPNPATGDVVEVPPALGVCLLCHNITGTNANLAKAGIGANPLGTQHGPNLTLYGCRTTIAAGALENTPENLATWLKETDQVKEGTYMPNYYKDGQIDDAAVQDIVDYLFSLKPEGGCPPEQPVGGDIGGTTDTLDAATPTAT